MAYTTTRGEQEILNHWDQTGLPMNATFSGDIEIGAVELKDGTTDTRAVIGFANSAAVGGLALNVADANVKSDTALLVTSSQLLDDTIYIDDSAFVAASGKVQTIAFYANETTPDSVTEGDVAAPRVTLDRRIITAGQSTDDAAPETGTRVNMMGGIFDDTATDSVDEGDAGFTRITADRKQITAGAYVDDTAFTPAGANSYVMMMGAQADETGPDSVDEGDAGALRMTPTRFLKISMGDLINGEDETNTVMQVVQKPLTVATYTYSRDSSAALEASSISKASAGNLYYAYGVVDATAPTDIYYIQFLDSATLTADGAVTHLITPIPVVHTTGTDSSFEIGDFDFGVAAANGIVIVLSTTLVTKTIAGSYLFATVLYK